MLKNLRTIGASSRNVYISFIDQLLRNYVYACIIKKS